MQFNTIKEMEDELKKITSFSKLKEDITFKSQGQIITLKFIGMGTFTDKKELSYLSNETADRLKISITGENDDIIVTATKISRA